MTTFEPTANDKTTALERYRRVRRTGRSPYEAMNRVRDDAAHYYLAGITGGSAADEPWLVRTAAVWFAADQYILVILAKYKPDGEQRPTTKRERFWVYGRIAGVR